MEIKTLNIMDREVRKKSDILEELQEKCAQQEAELKRLYAMFDLQQQLIAGLHDEMKLHRKLFDNLHRRMARMSNKIFWGCGASFLFTVGASGLLWFLK